MSKTRLVALLGLASLTPALAGAQVAPPDAGQLLNEQGRQPVQPQRPQAQAQLISGETAASAAETSGFTARIGKVRFSGVEGLVDVSALEPVVADVIGSSLTHAQMRALANRVTAALQAQGYLLARAYLPSQDLSDGELEIAVLAGQLEQGEGRVQVLAADAALAERLQAIASHALPQGAVRNAQIERALLMVNDVPGVRGRATLEKGSEPGSSRLLVNAETPRGWSGGASLDNHANRYTGQWRASVWGELYRPLGREDRLAASIARSAGSTQAGLNYGIGLHPNGLRANFAASWLDYEVGKEFKALELEGEATTFSAGLGYPVLRTRAANLWASVDVERKSLTDSGLGVELRDREMDKVTASLSGNRWDDWAGGGYTGASVALVSGHLELGNAVDRQLDGLGPRTRGSFSKLSWRVERSQSLGSLQHWGLYGSASGQVAKDNLDSSEKFLLGGPGGVRGLPVGEASGDSGWLLNAELRREFSIVDSLGAQAILFADHGSIRQHIEVWPGSLNRWSGNRYDLSSAGLGLNLQAEHWALRTAWAHRLGDNPGRSAGGLNADGRKREQYLWVQLAVRL
jgi:hemolysin activation/secretion protein